MNCPNCGTPLIPGTAFCAACGQNVTQITNVHPALPSRPLSQSIRTSQPIQPTNPAEPGASVAPQAPAAPSQPIYPYGYEAPAQPVPSPAQAQFAQSNPYGYTTPGGYDPPVQASGYGQPAPTGGYGPYGAYDQSGQYGQPSAPSGYGAPMMGPTSGLTPRAPMLAGLFGDSVHPTMARPYSRVQRFLVQNISPARATNMWITSSLGALVAGVAGLVLTLVAVALWSSAISSALSATTSNIIASAISGEIKSFLTPNVFQLFAIEQHVPLGITVTAGVDASGASASGSGDITIGIPLTGLLLLPALALMLGGYLSAASDFQRVARYSILRGALIAPFYAVFMAIIAFFATSSVSAGALGVSMSATAQPSIWQAFLYGLLWGALFGALGGWLHYSGPYFLSWALPVLQRARTQLGARVAGALAGSVVAYLSGFFLCLATIVGLYVYSIVTSAANAPVSTASTASTTPSGGLGAIGAALILIIVLVPTVATWVFAFAGGAPFTINETTTVSSAANQQASVGLFGSSSTVAGFTAPHLPQALYIALLLPLIAYLIGGRVAARVARAATPGDGALAGAMMAVPLSVIMAIAAACAGLSFDVSLLGQSAGASVAPSVGGSFLAVLIGGAIVGAIGGATAVSIPSLGKLPRLLVIPVRPLGLALFPLFDAVTRRPQGVNRSESREWLYGAALLGVGLGIVVIALDIVTVSSASVLPFKTLTLIDAIAAAVLVALPLMFLVGAMVAAFAAPTTLVIPPPAALAPIGAPALAGVAPMGYPAAPYPAMPYPAMPYPPMGMPMGMPTGMPTGQASAPLGVPIPAGGATGAPIFTPPAEQPGQSAAPDAPTAPLR